MRDFKNIVDINDLNDDSCIQIIWNKKSIKLFHKLMCFWKYNNINQKLTRSINNFNTPPPVVLAKWLKEYIKRRNQTFLWDPITL